MRIVIFPIMCHLPRGDEKNSLLIANMGSDHSTATRHTADAILQDLGEGRSYLPENPPRDLHMH